MEIKVLENSFSSDQLHCLRKGEKLPRELTMLDFFIKARCVRTKNLKWFQHKCFKKKMEKKTA